jgi:hypothetical protein
MNHDGFRAHNNTRLGHGKVKWLRKLSPCDTLSSQLCEEHSVAIFDYRLSAYAYVTQYLLVSTHMPTFVQPTPLFF